MVQVADLAEGGAALQEDLPQFAAGEADHAVVAFLGQQLRGAPGAANQLTALAGAEFKLWMKVPTGMFRRGRQLPSWMSAFSPLMPA